MAIAKTTALSNTQITLLENFGIYINYNGYGASLDDLHFEPAQLFSLLARYDDPLDFIDQDAFHFQQFAVAVDQRYLRNAHPTQPRGGKALPSLKESN